MLNTNATGWAPWVENSNGELVPFKPFDAESRLDSFYYSENLPNDTYILKGFMHVYLDYSLNDDDSIASYGPFENYDYDVRQFFPLAEEVPVTLGSRSIETFGRYFISSSWKGGMGGTADDRWKVVESSFQVTVSYPEDRKALRVSKNWATPNWLLWNEYNKDEAADL